MIANKAKCECPECSGLEEDSVCAMVGPDRDTYKNPCEARREACNNSLPMEILNEGECGGKLPYLDTPTTTTPVTSHVYVVDFFELFSWADQKVKKLSKFSPFRKLL